MSIEQPIRLRRCAILWCGLFTLAAVSHARADHLPAVLPVLPGSDHQHENLADLDFSGQDLKNVNFTSADLSRSNISMADLRGVMLLFSRIDDALFDGADLRGVDLDDIAGTGARFRGVNFVGASFEEANVVGWDFEGAVFSNVNFEEAEFIASSFRGANLAGVLFDDFHAMDCDFSSADFSGADFLSFNSMRSNFSGADFTGVTSSFGFLGMFLDANFRGTDLSVLDPSVDLNLAGLQGAVYDAATQFPAGFDPVTAGMVFIPEPATAPLATFGLLMILLVAGKVLNTAGTPARWSR